MAQIIGAYRIGRDVELRRLATGDAVCNLALAANYGKKGEDGNRPTQWVEASMFGMRAEALAPYLLKGTQVYAILGDPHIETYEGKNGAGHKLVARVLEIELIGSRPQGDGQQRQQAPAQQSNGYAAAKQRPQPTQPARQAPARDNSGFDDMSDDIPF
jgi:single-strand DNA-binding protein